MGLLSAADDITAGDHISVFYDKPEERWQLLAEYYDDGLSQDELCVFVTKETPAHARLNLRAGGLDIDQAVADSKFRMFTMEATYLPDGRFIADYMLHNVIGFIEEAKAQGYSGLRTAGEMDWLAARPEYHPEAAIYEHDVNTVGEDHPEFTGLCLYSVQMEPMAVVKNALYNHPVFIYEGVLHHNPYYLAPESFMTFVTQGDSRASVRGREAYEQLVQSGNHTPSTPADKAIHKLLMRAAPA